MSSNPTSTSTPALHPSALSGFAPASAYDSHRPSYPSSAISALLSHLRLTGRRNAKILDLAAGTGKFTELLAVREEEFEVVAVEPHGGMRAELVAKGLKGVTVREGTAAEIPCGDGELDGVIIAQGFEVVKNIPKDQIVTREFGQAFHWFANIQSLREIHRVLKPGGSLGLIWNVEDYSQPPTWPATTPSMTHLRELHYSLADGNPRFKDEKWQACFTPQSLFSTPLGEEIHKWTHYATPEKVWDRFSTLSLLVVVPEEEKEKLKTEAMGVLRKEADENDGMVGIHGVTVLAWTQKI